jgi:MFS family permease
MLRWLERPIFRQRDFVRLWAAQAVSAIGERITRTALPVMAVLTIEASPLGVGMITAIAIGPSVLVSLAMGGVVDRSRKRPILIASDLARAAAVLSLPIAAWTGVLTMAQLYAVAAVVGVGTALFQIADNAYLPTLLDKDLLVAGNSTIEATEAVAEIAGPSLAGVLIQALTAPFAVLLDALSYVASAALLGSIRTPEVPAAVEESPSVWRDIAIGFRASWGHPLVRLLLLATAVSTFLRGTFAALYMIYLLRELDLDVGTVGVVIGMGGVGALFGAIGSGPVTRRLGLGPAMVLFSTVCELSSLLIPAASGPVWLALALLLAHQLLGDGMGVAFLVQAVSLRQRVLPLDVLGRSNAAFLAVTGALLPLGALGAGELASVVGVRNALWIGMSGSLIAPLLLLPLWKIRDVPGSPGPVGSPVGSPVRPDSPPDSPALHSGPETSGPPAPRPSEAPSRPEPPEPSPGRAGEVPRAPRPPGS